MIYKDSKKIINNLKIINLGINGVGIAKNEEGKIIFIDQALPGDIVDVVVCKIRKKYLEAKIINFVYISNFRVHIKCKFFGICGGCKWQHLSYIEQLNYKQDRVLENIKRIGSIDYNFFVFPILASKEIFYYRNKVEFSFSNNIEFSNINSQIINDNYNNYVKYKNGNVLGFHVFKHWNKIIHIKECFLITLLANQIHNFVYCYSITHSLSFYNLKNRKGLLRHLMIRSNQRGEYMVVFQLSYFSKLVNNLFFELIKKFSQIVTLGYAINTGSYRVWDNLSIQWYKGDGFLFENIETLIFKIYAKSFFQINTKQAYLLYNIISKFAKLTGKELVFDLYSGVGTIAQYISFQSKRVIGIDFIYESIQSANESIKKNNIYNCEFICVDLKYIFACNLIKKYGFPDVMIVDPPRDGMHDKVLDFIVHSCVKKIIYVSCNPATQCRDLKILKSYYQLLKLQVIDMFPQTDNIESVMLLERKI